ncbi:hypothetical protein [Arthrobacter globiformis]|uniref:hypothetical protein n=1 Tax=Arthrobacter globiformis TaxID=1665 RepID=UPI0027936563|nr:hypothetical protein [Arthrobacter globiformis]MDQ0617793.1 hypothetical protein [Arthrobacter globiformis]
MTLSSAIVRPETRAWAALPKRISSRRLTILGWLTGLLGTAAALIADRGWESFDEPSWYGAFRFIDMMGIASILLASAFCVLGWMLGRYAVVAAPLVLGFAAVPHTLDRYASAPVWWLGSAAGAVLALAVASRSWRELRAVRALAQSSATGRTATVGSDALKASKRALRRGLIRALVFVATAGAGWVVALAALPTELGRTYEEMAEKTSSSAFAAAAAALSILAIATVVSHGWRLFAMSRVGKRLVWEVPSGAGLVPPWPFVDDASGLVPVKDAASGECICVLEFRRSFPDADDHLPEEGVHASDYCPLHGIDRINDLSAAEFAEMAAESWLWDEQSDLPERSGPNENRLLLYGFAGRTYTGIPLRARAGYVDASFPEIGLAREAEPGVVVPAWDKAERPAAGVLDTIDLRPAGYNGFAFRYRHDRAWFEAPEDDGTGPPALLL